jgi:hypothetical protein
MQVPSNIQGNPLAQSEDQVHSKTTVMPTLDYFQMYNNLMPISTQFMNSISITLEPQEQPMFLAKEHSTLQDAMDNTSPFVANFTVSALEINKVL